MLKPDMTIIDDFLEVIDRYGTPEEINQKARDAGELANLLEKVKRSNPSYLEELNWFVEQRDKGVFISEADYRRKVLGSQVDQMTFQDHCAVTLEISAQQYFPWLCDSVQKAIE